MSARPVLLVLGAGANIGKAIASKFSSAGYKVALAARSIPDGTTPEGHFGIKVDLNDPSSISSVFAKVKSELGTPNTIIYNAANVSPPPDAENLFSLPLETLERDVNIMSTSAFAAAKEAVKGFETLPKDTRKTFIYTGNILNVKILPVPALVTLGVGKSAAAYWIGLASTSFKKKGYGFYYGDQRTAQGDPVGAQINAEAHAEMYSKLATEDVDLPWHVSFVLGKGYVDFSKL
ncbi:NAD(P)-binding protein [Tothia fuscella]|uniref:NAD(P)-binding protein n=1 Tax=Tothia fuscella TaxID=1048955 RepID=A0A9P4TSH5_9PEZI|nr:NAD(P)-binding protein [Tothia fuscella]